VVTCGGVGFYSSHVRVIGIVVFYSNVSSWVAVLAVDTLFSEGSVQAGSKVR